MYSFTGISKRKSQYLKYNYLLYNLNDIFEILYNLNDIFEIIDIEIRALQDEQPPEAYLLYHKQSSQHSEFFRAVARSSLFVNSIILEFSASFWMDYYDYIFFIGAMY